DVTPFVPNYFKSVAAWWVMHTINEVYGKNQKPITLLSKNDYMVYTGTQTPVQSAAMFDNNKIFRGDQYLWVDKSVFNSFDLIHLKVEPKEFSGIKSKILGLKNNPNDRNTEIIISIDSPSIKSNDELLGFYIGSAVIKNISLTKRE
ncbi:MAG: hypothetical protein J1E29_07525, partial [Duncaniella sp.]|nr:hypothetical protein [Duncaniella sp.]